MNRPAALHLLLVACLALLVAAVYAPVRHYGHLALDDYVSPNPQVTGGLTAANVRWAFATPTLANWHPLTILGLQAEVSLFGGDAGAMHVANAVLHFLDAALLYWFFVRTTGRVGPSLVVAALFAVHPTKVESVAWISGLKDVLSTFFGLLALHAYVARRRSGRGLWTGLGLAAFVASLAAKQMLVTLPFLLVLIDVWPLRRVGSDPDSEMPLLSARTWRTLFVEKLPWFAVAAVFCVVALVAQSRGGTVASLTHVPAAIRVGNALLSYVAYLRTTFWPTGLAVHYPHPLHGLPWGQVACAGLGLAVVAGLVVASRRNCVLVGWCWFLGTLVPVIGLVQVGRQQYADRYLYLPQVGLFAALAFGIDESLRDSRTRRLAAAVVAGAAIVALAVVGRMQVGYWKDMQTLGARSLAVTSPDNTEALLTLAFGLNENGNTADAVEVYDRILRIEPTHAVALNNLGGLHLAAGDAESALACFDLLVARTPQDAEVRFHRGMARVLRGDTDGAATDVEEAVRLDPGLVDAHALLGNLLQTRREHARALAEYEETLRLDPSHVGARTGRALARLLSDDPRGCAADCLAVLETGTLPPRQTTGTLPPRQTTGTLPPREAAGVALLGHFASRRLRDDRAADTFLEAALQLDPVRLGGCLRLLARNGGGDGAVREPADSDQAACLHLFLGMEALRSGSRQTAATHFERAMAGGDPLSLEHALASGEAWRILRSDADR